MKINITIILLIFLISFSLSKIAKEKADSERKSKLKSKGKAGANLKARTTTTEQSKTTTATTEQAKTEATSQAKATTAEQAKTATTEKAKVTTTTTEQAKSNSTTTESAKLLSKSKSKTKGVDHKINGIKHAYPNPIINSVSKPDLGVNKQIPFISLSDALKEMNWEDKVKRQTFLDAIKYTYYKMTRAEAIMLFNIIDTDKDDLIDLKEYKDFSILYIMPFEACDTGKDHLLDLKDFKTCFAKDPKRQLITFRRRHEDKKEVEELVMNMLSTRGRPIMNIFDYVIFRRALFAWSKCTSSSKVMTKSAFKCAITTFISSKYLGRSDTDTIFNTGVGYGQGANLIDLDFISYLRVSYYTLAFVTFNESNPSGFLEKYKFLKSIQSDAFPNNFTTDEVELMYRLIAEKNEMNFPTFAFFSHSKRCFP